jgi:hypothetical protein
LRGELDRRVEVVCLEDEVAAQRLLDGDERPSVVRVFPSSTRTVVAVSGGCIWTPGLTPGVSLIARYAE